jgi:hypothetical protein
MEANNTLKYLDLFIHKTPTNWKTSIYRKPMFTDTIIPYTSNHPNQHKYAALKFLYYWLNSYGLQKEQYQQEENIIHNILNNNSFPINPQKSAYQKPKQQLTTQTPTHTWATFTYTRKETTFITNIFTCTKVQIAFHTNTTIQNPLMHKNQKSDKYASSGVYKLTCPDRKKAYVGQTGRSF